MSFLHVSGCTIVQGERRLPLQRFAMRHFVGDWQFFRVERAVMVQLVPFLKLKLVKNFIIMAMTFSKQQSIFSLFFLFESSLDHSLKK